MHHQEMPHDLKEIDGRILKTLHDGRNVPSNLAETLDVSRQWINQRLQQMESADYVRNVGRGVYELQPENIPDEDRDRLNIDATDEPSVADLQSELEDVRAERDDLQDTVDDLHSELENTHSSVDTHRLETLLDQIETAAERGDGDALRSAVEDAREVLDS